MCGYADIEKTCIDLDVLLEAVATRVRNGVVMVLLDASRAHPGTSMFRDRLRSRGEEDVEHMVFHGLCEHIDVGMGPGITHRCAAGIVALTLHCAFIRHAHLSVLLLISV